MRKETSIGEPALSSRLCPRSLTCSILFNPLDSDHLHPSENEPCGYVRPTQISQGALPVSGALVSPGWEGPFAVEGNILGFGGVDGASLEAIVLVPQELVTSSLISALIWGHLKRRLWKKKASNAVFLNNLIQELGYNRSCC